MSCNTLDPRMVALCVYHAHRREYNPFCEVKPISLEEGKAICDQVIEANVRTFNDTYRSHHIDESTFELMKKDTREAYTAIYEGRDPQFRVFKPTYQELAEMLVYICYQCDGSSVEYAAAKQVISNLRYKILELYRWTVDGGAGEGSYGKICVSDHVTIPAQQQYIYQIKHPPAELGRCGFNPWETVQTLHAVEHHCNPMFGKPGNKGRVMKVVKEYEL